MLSSVISDRIYVEGPRSPHQMSGSSPITPSSLSLSRIRSPALSAGQCRFLTCPQVIAYLKFAKAKYGGN
ncbi:hypothetical protein L6164_008656 [Bauhinia variegata]|uniref:Uncharacterized protein n=1 Tax=Bauhinia variegata TaxID=167791 RepID=A0ACB9PH53_BAUVA|nr:hypothetical protein L6164_008656 [Bauhinia variegata]